MNSAKYRCFIAQLYKMACKEQSQNLRFHYWSQAIGATRMMLILSPNEKVKQDWELVWNPCFKKVCGPSR